MFFSTDSTPLLLGQTKKVHKEGYSQPLLLNLLDFPNNSLGRCVSIMY